MLKRMEDKLGPHHSGELRLESAAAKAERIVAEELQKRGWTENDLSARRRGDPEKLAIAAWLRRETTLPVKTIAARVHLGTSKSANARLHQWMRTANIEPQEASIPTKTNHAMGLTPFLPDR